MDNKERLELARWAMKYALSKGASETAVNISNERNIEIQFRDKKIESLKESTQNSLNISIYIDKRFSSQSTNDMRKPELEKFIDEAIAATKYMSPDEFRCLPDPKYYPKSFANNLDMIDKDYEKILPAERVKMAEEIEKIAMAQSDKIISVTSTYQDSISSSVKVQSNGFEGTSESTIFAAGASVTVRDGDAGRPEGYDFAVSRFSKKLPTPELLGKKSAKNALERIGQKKIESGKYITVVDNKVASRLLSMLIQPLAGRALQQKSSYLDGMLGKKVASEKLTIIDDPTIIQGLNSRIYDGEGLAAVKRTIIENGILKTYLIDTYYGKKMKMEPNGGSTSNMVFAYGNRSQDQIMSDIKRGLFITGFIGGNSNPTTGDFSFGISGHLIENGKPAQPIYEMNISGNGKDFWNHLVELGNDPYQYSSWLTPTLLFDEIDYSGI